MKKISTAIAAIVFVATLFPVAASAEGDIGVGGRIDLVLASSYKVSTAAGSFSGDGDFGAGFGLVADYKLMDFFKVGFDFTYYTVKSEGASDRDGLIAMGPRAIGCYAIQEVGPFDAITPYAFLTMGFGHYTGGEGKSGFWIVGGAGGEWLFGSFGAFLELSYGGNIMDNLTYTGFGMAVGGKYYF